MSRVAIVSPVPGVCYLKPSPDEPEFFKEGDAVRRGDTVCLIEIMKTYFEVKAERDGVLVGFSVKSGDIVEAGQELAVLEVAGE